MKGVSPDLSLRGIVDDVVDNVNLSVLELNPTRVSRIARRRPVEIDRQDSRVRIAARSDARVLFAWCERLPGTSPPRFALHVEAAPEAVGDADPVRAVTALNAGIEAIARRDFSQYQWTYKRYTLRPPGSGEANPYLDLYR